MITTVLFDLDGTLVDTEPAATRAILGVFKDWGRELASQDAGVITGRTWEAACRVLLEKHGVKVALPEAVKTLMARYRQELEQGLDEVPGARESVAALARSGLRLALVSGSMRAEIAFALRQLRLESSFEVVLGAEDYPASKPAPDGYQKALKILGVSASQAVVFEDSHPGIASGRAVGARVVAITSTNHFGHDQSGAQQRIADLRGIDAHWLRAFDERFPA